MATYSRVHKQKIDSQVSRLLLHVLREAHIVTPICAVVLLFDVSLEPSMRIRGMQEIDLAPFERPPGPGRRVLSIGLHPPDMARKNDIMFGLAIAAVISLASQRAANCGRSSK